MRGSFLHNRILLDPIEDHFRACGAVVHREHPTRPGRDAGFIDLFVELPGWPIACEVELTTQRILADLHKAQEIGARLLLIIVPTRKLARQAMARLHEGRNRVLDLAVWILPLGPALKRLRDCFPIFSATNVSTKSNTESILVPGGAA